MSLRAISRLGLVAGVAMLVGGFVAAAQPAGAVERDRVTLGQDEHFTIEYDGFVGSNPGTQADEVVIDPAVCAKLTYCDLIPLTVSPPRNLDNRKQEFYVTIAVYWDAGPGSAIAAEAQNDLDLYVRPVSDDPADPRGDADSASADVPEKVTIPGAQGDYAIIVNNFNGDGGPYKVEYTWSTDTLDTPFESLPPSFFGSGTTSEGSEPTPVLTPPVGETPTFEAPSIEVPDLSVDTPALPDGAFDAGFGDGATLDDQLSASDDEGLVFKPTVRKAPLPEAPSDLALGLWMVGLPVLLIGIGAAILQRRSRTLLSL